MKKSVKIFCFFAALLFVLPLFAASCENSPQIDGQKKTEGQSEERTEAVGTDAPFTAQTEKTEETEPATEETTEDDGEWDEALKKHESDDGLVWLIEFANSHPDSRHIPEALERIEKIRTDPSYSEKYLFEPTLDKIDEFISKFPGHMDIGRAYALRGEFTGDICEMMQKGFIAAISVGESIMRNVVQIQNNTDSKLEVTMPFGTYFLANSGNVQNMLAREEKRFFVRAGQIGVLYVDTVCMNIYKDIPGEKNYFTVDKLGEDSRLVNLLKILDENGSSYEVAQAAVWQIADNPGKESILSALVYEEGVRAISEADYAEALRLVGLAEN